MATIKFPWSFILGRLTIRFLLQYSHTSVHTHQPISGTYPVTLDKSLTCYFLLLLSPEAEVKISSSFNVKKFFVINLNISSLKHIASGPHSHCHI